MGEYISNYKFKYLI